MKHQFKQIVKDISDSKVFKIVIKVFCAIVIVCLIFQAGEIAGFHKASYGRDWNTNFSRNFGSHTSMLMPDNFPNAHGAFGKIVKVQLPTIIVEDKDMTEKVVLITDKTEIHKMRDTVAKENLTTDMSVVVIGSPNDQGQIEARLIRILPAPMIDIDQAVDLQSVHN